RASQRNAGAGRSGGGSCRTLALGRASPGRGRYRDRAAARTGAVRGPSGKRDRVSRNAMRRTLIFLVKLAVVVALAVWLAERPGTVTLKWLNWEVHSTVGGLIAVVAVGPTLFPLIHRFRPPFVPSPPA